MRRYLCLALLALLPAVALAAEPKSLDDQLFDDLSTELLPTKKAETKKPSAPKADDAGLNDKLLDQLGEGEDIDLGDKPDPLTKIGRTMRKVEQRIGERDTSASTQEMQKQILVELQALLEQTKKQCQGGQCKSPSASPKPSSAAAGNKPGEGEPNNKPARDSTDRMAKAGKTDVAEGENMDELVKQVWGHLPPKVRDQMQNVSVENFLPKYEKLIEEYYKRLAEEK
jgi:hypothetical protein